MPLESIEERIAHGWELLEAEEWRAAQAWGKALAEEGELAGYRIQAAAMQMGLDDLEAAKQTLLSGLTDKPGGWAIYMHLATLEAESGDFELAHTHLDLAKNLPDAEVHWIQFNQAVLLLRQEQWEEGLNLLQEIEHPEVINEAFCLQLEVLDNFGQYDTILELAESDLEVMEVPRDDDEATTMGRICCYIATAAWHEERGAEMVRHYLRQAVTYDRTLDEALWLSRELEATQSEGAQLIHMIVQGQMAADPESGQPGDAFVTSYGVVAPSLEAALEYIRRYETDEVDWDSLVIVESETFPNEENFEDGIYAVSDFMDPDEADDLYTEAEA